MEGGSSDKESSESLSHSSRKRRVRGKVKSRNTHKSSPSKSKSQLHDETYIDLDSEEEKSDINIKDHQNPSVSPGKLFKEGVENGEIDDIPNSAFESSDSSDTDGSFVSYSKEELIAELKNQRQQISVGEFTEGHEDDPPNAAEQVMISLSDIAVEIDQGLNDNRRDFHNESNHDNGNPFSYRYANEKEVKLYDNDSLMDKESVSDFVPRANTHFKSSNRIDDLKTVHESQLEDLKKEVYLESTIRDLERRMLDSSKQTLLKNVYIATGELARSKLEPFMREYLTNETRVREAKFILEELLEQAENYRGKLKADIDKEDQKIEENNKKEKELRIGVKHNIPRTKTNSKMFKKGIRKTSLVQNTNMVHPGHENFNLVFNIMLGIKKAIEAVIDFPMFEIQKKDFKIK